MKKKSRGQPKKVIKRKAVRLTFLPSIRNIADQLAFAENKSLSRFLEDLVQEYAKTKEVAYENYGD